MPTPCSYTMSTMSIFGRKLHSDYKRRLPYNVSVAVYEEVKNPNCFEALFQFYEAWVIYNFLSLCLAWVGGPGAFVLSLSGRALNPSWALMTCFPTFLLDGRFIRRCKQGCLQFVFLKPVLVTITFLLYAKGKCEDGNFSANQGYLYITIICTISYSMALYALVLFYVACRDLLRPFNPVPKFIMIKSVVFLTYWQLHSSLCRALRYVLDRVCCVLPEVESARPGCTSGIKKLCSLYKTSHKAKLVLEHCAESSKLYLISGVVSYLKDRKFVIDSGDEEADKTMLELLRQTETSEKMEFERSVIKKPFYGFKVKYIAFDGTS